MPILIFIAQRLILLALAIMTFLGVTSEETYLNASDNFAIDPERKAAITEILDSPNPIIISTEEETPVFEKIKLDIILDKINRDIPIFGQKNNIEEEDYSEPEKTKTFDTEIQADTNDLLKEIEAQINTLKAEADKAINKKTEEDDLNQPKENTLHIANVANNAVINIMCLKREGNGLSVITGSGVIISPNGTIITNGHVAQNLLDQDDENIDCEVKNPNHSSMNYRAVISYIPSIWKGAGMFNLKYGTGENDYAFLSIVGPGPDGKMPDSFPYVEVSTNSNVLSVGNDIFMLGYPGKHTGVYSTDTNLPLVTGTSYITDIFTFDKSSKDIFSSGVSPVAMQGSSGGAVIDEGKLIGIISTTNEHESGGNILNAISLNYIKRDLEENGLSLSTFTR